MLRFALALLFVSAALAGTPPPTTAPSTTAAPTPPPPCSLGSAYVFSQTTARTIAVNADTVFDGDVLSTPSIVHSSASPAVTVANAGVYRIAYTVSGSEPNQFALFANGVPLLGTVYGSGAGSQQNRGSAIVVLPSSVTVVTLRNYASPAAVTLATPVGGATANVMVSLVVEQVGSFDPYGYVYAEGPFSLALGADVRLSVTGVLSGGPSGVTHPVLTELRVHESAVYRVEFSASPTQPSQFAVAVNGVVAPSTRYGSDAGTQQNSGQALLVLAAGDTLTLRNSGSTSSLSFASSVGGTQPNVAASLLVVRAEPQSAYVYAASSAPAPVLIGADVAFTHTGPLGVGFSHAPASTQLHVTAAGEYRVTFSVSANEANQFALAVNGAVVADTLYGSGATTQQNTGQALVTLAAGDALTLRNVGSTTATFLASPGGVLQAVVASLLVEATRCYNATSEDAFSPTPAPSYYSSSPYYYAPYYGYYSYLPSPYYYDEDHDNDGDETVSFVIVAVFAALLLLVIVLCCCSAFMMRRRRQRDDPRYAGAEAPPVAPRVARYARVANLRM